MNTISGASPDSNSVVNEPLEHSMARAMIKAGAFTPRAREYLNKVDNVRLEKPFDSKNIRKIVNDKIRIAKRSES